jgi:hypothetical protein
VINSRKIGRALVLTTALAACAGPTASAQVADTPARATAVATPPGGQPVDEHGVPPRVDGMAAHSADRVVPVVEPTRDDGFGWPSAAIAGAALLSVVLLGLAAWSSATRGRETPRGPGVGPSTAGRA